MISLTLIHTLSPLLVRAAYLAVSITNCGHLETTMNDVRLQLTKEETAEKQRLLSASVSSPISRSAFLIHGLELEEQQ